MPVIVLGMTILLAQLFPLVFTLLPRLLIKDLFPGYPNLVVVVLLIVKFLFPLLITIIFVQKSKLKSRLPNKIPGKTEALIGLIMWAIFWLASIFGAKVAGSLGIFVVGSVAAYIMPLANVFLLIGIVKVLLAALPRMQKNP
ncbi:MAG: hypothetical protein LBE62_15020 [Azonexus sp.]|jgi:hypothetical protein|nr:hypothetical protein [Azonexus sp.]